MRELKARDVLSEAVVLVGAENHLIELQRLIQKKHPTHLAVFEAGRFLGLVSLRETVQHPRTWIFADMITSRADQAIQEETPVSELQSWNWFEADAIAVVDADGGFVGVITQSSLITELLQQQAQAQQRIQNLFNELRIVMRRAVMAEFAAAFAHEVHQPLAAITNYAHAMKRGLSRNKMTPEKLEDGLTEILDSCRTAADIVRRLREFLEGQMPAPVPVDLVAVVEDALALAKPQLDEARVTCSFQYPDDRPWIAGVAAALVQVIYNLVLNAIEAFSEGEPMADPHIQIALGLAGPDRVQLFVEDNGPGISADVRSHVFDPLFTTKPGNDGLGLSLCRSIVGHLGGELSLDEHIPHGCRVQMIFPVEERSISKG